MEVLPAGTQIADLIRIRSREGFDLLYRQYAHVIYGTCMRLVQDESVAEDIVQETFVKAWKHIEQFSPDRASFTTWILNIARYTTIDYLRSKQHKQRQRNLALEDSDLSIDKPSLAANADNIGLKSMVAKMEPKYRVVIDLIYFSGYTQEEAASILQIPIGTVKTRTRFALGQLRGLVKK